MNDKETKLGVESMDKRHEEFLDMVKELQQNSDDTQIVTLFLQLIEHTRIHFAEEEETMKKIAHANLFEHTKEHEKALQQMSYFLEKANEGKLFFTKAYIRDGLYDWFRKHVLNMDSDLARDIKIHL